MISRHEDYTFAQDMTGRIAHRIVYFLQELKSSVYFEAPKQCVDAKSLAGILSLGLKKGDIFNIHCYSDNEEQVNSDMVKIIDFLKEIMCDVE